MRNDSVESSRENREAHFTFNNFFSFENRAVYEIWINVVASQMTIWRMRYEGCITKATNKHSEYVTVITFHRQQQLR